tara:strand:+ start:392 stop:1165 length:774 start_codon:yes stop_codon:yes gene_type:complete
MKKRKKFKINFINTLIIISIFLVVFSSVVNIYEKRKMIASKISKILKGDFEGYRYKITYKKELAEKIKNGGFILWFRHAEREKWIDVTKYDSLETNLNLKGEKNFFEKAVCLSERGTHQARAMGMLIKYHNIPISKVISSPSCRARQTANLAFGGYDELKYIFLHKGPYYEIESERIKILKNVIMSYKNKENSNLVLSGHNGTIEPEMFDLKEAAWEEGLEEGGFYVMKKKGNKLIYVDKFINFQDFNKSLQIRPKD